LYPLIIPRQHFYSGIEYGANENYSLVFEASKHDATEYYRETKSCMISVKYKILDSAGYIISLQPKSEFSTDSKQSKEMWILFGHSRGQNSLSIGVGYGERQKIKYLYITNTESVDLSYFTVSSFSRYYKELNRKTLFSEMIYEQVSLQKKFKTSTYSIGYFWDINPHVKAYKNCGFVFNIRFRM
jgi:hypothetical protein